MHGQKNIKLYRSDLISCMFMCKLLVAQNELYDTARYEQSSDWLRVVSFAILVCGLSIVKGDTVSELL